MCFFEVGNSNAGRGWDLQDEAPYPDAIVRAHNGWQTCRLGNGKLAEMHDARKRREDSRQVDGRREGGEECRYSRW